MKKLIKFNRLFLGLKILQKYCPAGVEINPVPNSFPNGAPATSNSAYISVEIPFENQSNLEKYESSMLISLGWQKECEGDFWTFK